MFSIFPPGGKAGSTVEVTVNGADLDEAAQFLFSSTNITASPKPGEPNKFLITVASNAAPGVYDARLAGRFGVSNPRGFVVGDWPELVEKEGNNKMAAAMEIPLGAVVNGRADASAMDFFKFSVRKGQRVLVECVAQTIDSRLDAALVLYDSSGRELERNRRDGLLDFTAAADGQYFLKLHDVLFRGGAEYFYRLSVGTAPHVDYVFPPAGLPGTKGKYMLYGRNLPGSTPATGPQLSGNGKEGRELRIDGKVLEQLEVEIELPSQGERRSGGAAERGSVSASQGLSLQRADAAAPRRWEVDGFEYRLQTPQGVSNPILICFGTGPVVAEQEPNNQPGQAQKISLPCEVVGQFYPAGDLDRFSFEAKKGAVYWVEVFSQRLGLPTSPFLLVQRVTKNEKGEEQSADLQEVYASDSNIGGTEFKTSTLDPAWRFEVKEDGTYRVEVRDLFNLTQSNPRHVYRLSLRSETPDFRLAALAQAPAPVKKDAREAHVWTASLRRGETIPLKVLAFRRDNFNGEIQLSVEGLPAGVSYSQAKIEAGKNSAVLLLTAAENAATWTGPLRIIGKAGGATVAAAAPGSSPVKETEMIREARGGSVLWNVGDYNSESVKSRLTQQIVLGVSGQETAPISIAAAESSSSREDAESKVWEARAGSKTRIPLRVSRHGEFTETLKLKATGLAALDALKEIDVDGKATNATLELDPAQYKLAPGAYTFYLQTQTKGRYRNNPEGAQAAELAAKEAEKAANDLAAAAKQADAALAAASKAASEAEAGAKSAAQKSATAKTLSEKTPDKQELAAASLSAEKDAAAAAAKAAAAAETRAAAEKTASEAATKAKEAETKKTALAARAKEMTEKAKPREVTVTVYSAPIRLKVAAEEKKVAASEKKAS